MTGAGRCHSCYLGSRSSEKEIIIEGLIIGAFTLVGYG